jgi:lipopolysaccharide export system protein LptA
MLKLNWIMTLVLLILLSTAAHAQTNVEIIGGEKLTVDQRLQHTYIVDNVVLKHNGVIIQCDSAIRKAKEGIVEGFGHIYIFQQDTFTLSGGDYLMYEESSRIANVTGKNVILKDQSMTLLTTSLGYNMANQVGFYTNGADILSDGNTLKSKRGYYNRRTNVFNFKENVNLTGADFTMTGDTLDYYSGTSTAYFYGPTKIVSKENTIDCRYGWYNTKTEKALFSKGAALQSEKSSIFADSLIYNKKIGLGRGIGNIRLIDSSENMTVYGQYGWYNQKSDLSMVTQEPMAMQAKDGDTMMVMADTFYYRNDSLQRTLRAFGNANVNNKDLQGKCDSLVYNFLDSTIFLYKSPILWSDNNQITGDSILIFLKEKKIDHMNINGNSFLAAFVKKEHFNQISGKKMRILFVNGDINKVFVNGNAESIYYLRDNETDSAEYSGVNRVACDRMMIQLDSSKVKGIKFFTQVEGKMYPIPDFPESERKLGGFVWLIDLKMPKEAFLKRANIKLPKPKEKELPTPKAIKENKKKTAKL